MKTLMMGDCLELMREIPDGSIDMVLADLPYGTTSCKWDTVIPFEPLWAAYRRVCKKSAAIVLTASQPFTSALVLSNPDWFKYELVWHKERPSAPGVAKYRPLPQHETILVFGSGRTTYNPQMGRGEPYRVASTAGGKDHAFGFSGKPFVRVNSGERFPTSVLSVKTQRRNSHPTQKPVALMEYLIRTYTNAGQTVLDNTMGSGTTGVACVNTGRRYIGI